MPQNTAGKERTRFSAREGSFKQLGDVSDKYSDRTQTMQAEDQPISGNGASKLRLLPLNLSPELPSFQFESMNWKISDSDTKHCRDIHVFKLDGGNCYQEASSASIGDNFQESIKTSF